MSDDRPCTCHPAEGPTPCQKGYALSVCLRRALEDANLERERFRTALWDIHAICNNWPYLVRSRKIKDMVLWALRRTLDERE